MVAKPQPGGDEGGGPCDGYCEPTWSPDGEFVTFAVETEGECDSTDDRIEIGRGYGAPSKVVVRGPLFAPDWSPRGGVIALSEFSYYTGRVTGIKLFNLRTKRLTDLHDGWHATWSRDGARLVFVRGSYLERSRIYVMSADGSNVRQLTG